MENVPQVHGEGAKEDFNKWQLRLEELGYKNYWQDLIATDYGIPQTRNRTFMISILGNYNYTFPKPIPLKLKLKDMLEDNIDEKYFLSDKQINDIQNWSAYEKPLENMEKTEKNNISPTLTTRSGAYAAGMILVKNANSKGYLEATDGDGVDISGRMQYHRGTVQKGKTQTLSTMGGENNGVVLDDLRIRKLTPKECFRLMGVRDEDYDKIAENQSDSSLYHLAGDSIVVDVLIAIFGEMLGDDKE